MNTKKHLVLYNVLAILFISIAILFGGRSECQASGTNTLADAVLDEGGKSEIIPLAGDFSLDVSMHTEVTDENYHCLYLEMTLEDRLLIICFTNYDGNGQYRWWSDIKKSDGTIYIQKNCFKDIPANMDIAGKDIRVNFSREGENVTLQAYRIGEQGQELFCDYALEVESIPENVNVYFGGENYKISNVGWSTQTLEKSTGEEASDAGTTGEEVADNGTSDVGTAGEEATNPEAEVPKKENVEKVTASGIKVSEAETNNKLSDVVLKEGSKSERISLAGDFLLDVSMHTNTTEEKNNCLYLEMTMGEDILVVCFSHCERGDYGSWADIIHPDGSRDIQRDCFEYVGTNSYIEDKNIEVEFCRKGNKVTLEAKRTGLFRSKTFCDFELELENLPEAVTIYFGGENVEIRDIQWNVGEVPPNPLESMSLILEIIVLLVLVALSVVLYQLVTKKFQPAVENAWYIDIPSFFDILAALCLAYGGIMVLSWYQWPLANRIINFVNRIYIFSELSIPSPGMLLANRIVVIVVLIIGAGILIYQAVDFGISAVFGTFIIGVLKLLALYMPISFCVQMLAAFIGALPSMLVLLFLLFLISGLSESTTTTDYDPLHTRKVDITENGFHRSGEIINIMGDEYLKDGSTMSRLTKNADGTWTDEAGNRYNNR